MAYIYALRLANFRSYASFDIALKSGPIVIYGPNGAGKTNLLEALSLLSPGRGLRRAASDKLAFFDGTQSASGWGINARLDSQEQISVGQVPEYPRRRLVKLDGKVMPSTHLSRYLALMWLTPLQDRLFIGPASDRRRFLDRFALAHEAEHGAMSLRYEKARSERNRLLSDGIDEKAWYEALEYDLARHGTQILKHRFETLARLQQAINSRDSLFPKSKLSLEGEIETLFTQIDNIAEFESLYKQKLADLRAVDRRAGRTLFGPHRSDLIVTHLGKSMPAAQCSTGEQKALLIGLILAQARAQAHNKPILLLDEVTAHLDEKRRAALAHELFDLKTQIFMTGTDRALFSDFEPQAQYIHIQDSTIYGE